MLFFLGCLEGLLDLVDGAELIEADLVLICDG